MKPRRDYFVLPPPSFSPPRLLTCCTTRAYTRLPPPLLKMRAAASAMLTCGSITPCSCPSSRGRRSSLAIRSEGAA